MVVGVDFARVLAAALSLAFTGAIMILLKAAHPPAGATTLIISLGIVTRPSYLLVIEVAVALLTLQAIAINRLAGLDYPLWAKRVPNPEGFPLPNTESAQQPTRPPATLENSNVKWGPLAQNPDAHDPRPAPRTDAPPRPGEPDACYLLDLSGWARGIHEVRRPLAGDHVVSRSVVGTPRQPAPRSAAGVPRRRRRHARRPTWQNAIWHGYKAKRVDPGAAYDAEIETILRVLAAHRIPVFRAAGFEADDLLATAARRARRAGLRVVIVSRDHDLYQLCDEAGEIVIWDGTAETADRRARGARALRRRARSCSPI